MPDWSRLLLHTGIPTRHRGGRRRYAGTRRNAYSRCGHDARSGKLIVLVLLGFAVTDFIITMTRSVADASAHITLSTESPRVLPLTIALFTALAVVFYRGFSEAIGVSILLVIAYLLLNIIVIAVGLTHIAKAMAAQMASAAKSTATNACSSLSQRS